MVNEINRINGLSSLKYAQEFGLTEFDEVATHRKNKIRQLKKQLEDKKRIITEFVNRGIAENDEGFSKLRMTITEIPKTKEDKKKIIPGL